MRIVITFLLVVLSLNSVAQTTTEKNWVDSEMNDTDRFGNTFSITHSLPKGGAIYTDNTGKIYSYVIFWYCITNTAEVPLELAIQFPAENYSIFDSKDSHIRIVLPSETMTSEKITQFDYGLTNLKDFLDTELGEPNRLKKIIYPNEEYFFYSSVLVHQASGSARAAFLVEDQKLFYQIKIGSDFSSIPCGSITFKE